jgi:hypothetical protein
MQLDLLPKAPRRARMDHARARAEYGLERVETSAESASPGWCDQACERLRRFAAGQGGLFTVELARMAFEKDLPPPPDLRAWGVVARMAASRGFIERVKGVTFAAESSNGSEKPCYRRGPKA